MQTAERGHRVYFTTAMDLAVKLTRAVDGNRLHRELKALVQPKLLVIDEVGYLTLDGRASASKLLILVVDMRLGGVV